MGEALTDSPIHFFSKRAITILISCGSTTNTKSSMLRWPWVALVGSFAPPTPL